ncbi:MAG: hypothetical protein AB1609_12705 [Bacillota bacterium]
MWSSLLAWAQEIVAMAVVFTLASLLLPHGSLRGTVRTVMGVALLAAAVGPVVGLVEDAALWSQAAARWQAPSGPAGVRESAPEPAPLVREGLEETMTARAMELVARKAERAVRRVLEGAGYEALAVEPRPVHDGDVRLVVRARRRSAVALPEDRLPAYLAAVAGLSADAVELHVEP